MLTVQKILFPTDFSACAEHAFSHAAQIAARFDAEIHVFHTQVRHSETYPALHHLLDEVEPAPVATGTQPLSKHMASADGDRVLVISRDVVGTSACEEILAYADEQDIDMIVMGTHGRRGPRRLILGSTAACVIRNASCPVLTLRSDAEIMDADKLAHILVPVDFSAFSKEALEDARALATLWQAKITLVHVVEEAIFPTVYGIEPAAYSQVGHLLDRANQELRELADAHFKDLERVETHTLIGPPASTIAAYAGEQDVDLIVLASHGLTGFKRLLLGSVAESLNHQAPCAVLTLKPLEKKLLKS